jgi:hypothetical protein
MTLLLTLLGTTATTASKYELSDEEEDLPHEPEAIKARKRRRRREGESRQVMPSSVE